MYSKETLRKFIKLIEEISNEPDNEWFKGELLKSLHKKIKIENDTLIDVKKDTSKIVDFLDINPSCSVDYSYIRHKLLRTRLELDNLRMENVRYNLKEKDEMKRLYDFIINAFYQVENMINYYYFEKFPKIEDLLDHLEKIPRTKFQRKHEQSIGDITISVKIFSFVSTFYKTDQDFTGYNIDSLRLIRNEGVHRISRIKNIENENQRLHQFLKYATFDSIHALVNSLSIKINQLLNKT